jgi:hypothetical protein
VNVTIRALKALAAFGLAALVSFGALLLGGVALPVWGLAGIFGSKAMHDAPGHGGVAVLALMVFTFPVAALFSLGLALWLTVKFYTRFTRHPIPHGDKSGDVV